MMQFEAMTITDLRKFFDATAYAIRMMEREFRRLNEKTTPRTTAEEELAVLGDEHVGDLIARHLELFRDY